MVRRTDHIGNTTEVAIIDSRSAVAIAGQDQAPTVQWLGGQLELCSAPADCD